MDGMKNSWTRNTDRGGCLKKNTICCQQPCMMGVLLPAPGNLAQAAPEDTWY
ncbi:hypothetical protein SXCC_01435 [Gluconacetobacter sp. SXCC-1]|nr:hypothetical protein SXCC_01435 [Gluconacetobacter sp. SXCC-1]